MCAREKMWGGPHNLALWYYWKNIDLKALLLALTFLAP